MTQSIAVIQEQPSEVIATPQLAARQLTNIVSQRTNKLVIGGKHDSEIFVFPKMAAHLVGKKVSVVVRQGKLAYE